MASGDAGQITRELFDTLFGQRDSDVSVRLWDGSDWPDSRPRKARIVLKHPGSLRAMFLGGSEVALGEAYLYDDFDIEGDVEAIYGVAEDLRIMTLNWRLKLGLAAKLLRLPAAKAGRSARRGRSRLGGQRHSVERDRLAIAYHYDVSNSFYSLFLDSRLVYSCAYFAAHEEDLESAQERKLDYICRKLRLQPEQRLLDVGCGWGGLVIYAAQHYGVEATGITLSQPQAELANERIAQAGLSDRCRVDVLDYREVPETQPFDALVSVGMFEHVGEAMLPAYFRKARKLLRPGGVFLNHGIAGRLLDGPPRGRTFSDTYVFPDGELVPISTTLRVAEATGFEVRDVESLREHYALTLRQWVRRLEERHEQALQYVDEPVYRVWRLFMSGSAHGFGVGRLNLYQSLLVRPDSAGSSRLPLQRSDWYREAQ